MVYRKNIKRIDPRYFLHETVDRNDDGSAFEEPETVSVGGDIEGFQQPEEEEDTSNVAALLGTAEGTLLARMLAREILDRFGTFEELATAFPQIPRDRLSAQWVAAIKHNPMYGSSGLKEAYEEPKEESLLRMLWDMLMTKKYDRYDERDPVSHERDRDRERDEEQAKKDMEHRKRNPVPDAPETYGRPHALKTRQTVTESEDSTPPVLARWADLFPKAAEALAATLRALAGEEIPGLVKHDRTPAQRAIDQAELAQAKKDRGPQPEPHWGKFEEWKKSK